MTALLVVIAAVYGLLIGSFLNAWAWRLAHDEKISRGARTARSAATRSAPTTTSRSSAGSLLRGRCRDCGAPISWRYPVGEALTAAIYVGVVLMDGLDWVLVPHLLFVSALILVSQVDLDIRIIPDVIILPVAAVGVPLMILFGDGPWWEWIVAGVGAAGFLFLISEVYYRVRHVEGMGFGDVKLALCMGIYLGAAVVPALFIGFLSGADHRGRGRRRAEGGREDGDPLRAVPRRRRGRGAVRRRAAHRRVPGAGARPLTRVSRRSLGCVAGANVIRGSPTSSSQRRSILRIVPLRAPRLSPLNGTERRRHEASGRHHDVRADHGDLHRRRLRGDRRTGCRSCALRRLERGGRTPTRHRVARGAGRGAEPLRPDTDRGQARGRLHGHERRRATRS